MRSQSFYRLAATAAAFFILSCTAVGYALTKLRSDTIEETYVHIHSLTSVLSAQVSHSLGAIDEALFDVQQNLSVLVAAQDLADLPQAQLHDLMRAGRDRFPHADGVGLLDAKGRLIATSHAAVPATMDLSDRDYFVHFAQGQSSDLFVSAPATTRITGVKTLFFAKPVRHDGKLVGVVVLGLPIAHLRHIYDSGGVAAQHRVLLTRRDGRILVLHPSDKDLDVIPADSEWHTVVSRGGGSLRTGPDDGLVDKPHLAHVVPVTDFPLALGVLIAEDSALAIWRERSFMIAAGTALGLICAALLLVNLLGKMRSLEESERTVADHSRALEQYKLQLEVAVGSMRQGISMFDAEHRLVLCNQRYRDIYKLPAAKVRPGCSFEDILNFRKQNGNYAENSNNFQADTAARHVAIGKTFSHTVHLPDGTVISVVAEPTKDGGWVATHEDVTEQHRSLQQIAYLATHDTLTGLFNRHAFDRELASALAALATGEQFALLSLDLDGFKAVNDTYGHPAGDQLLEIVASRIRMCTAATDVAARLGGDEFVVMQRPSDRDGAAARTLAHKILDELEKPVEIGACRIKIGASVGIAVAGPHGKTAVDILRNVDLALYQAKSQGRGHLHVFNPANLQSKAG